MGIHLRTVPRDAPVFATRRSCMPLCVPFLLIRCFASMISCLHTSSQLRFDTNFGGPAPLQEQASTLDPLLAGCVHPFPAVRLRGLPFGSSREEIADFLEVRPIDIVFQERGGRPNGVAFVLTANSEDYQRCIDKDKQNLGSRYIEVFPCARSVRQRHLQCLPYQCGKHCSLQRYLLHTNSASLYMFQSLFMALLVGQFHVLHGQVRCTRKSEATEVPTKEPRPPDTVSSLRSRPDMFNFPQSLISGPIVNSCFPRHSHVALYAMSCDPSRLP